MFHPLQRGRRLLTDLTKGHHNRNAKPYAKIANSFALSIIKHI